MVETNESSVPSSSPVAASPSAGEGRVSGLAVASLVVGIASLLLSPLGLVAVPLGVVGLRATRRPAVRGRGLAIAGLVTGGLGVAILVVGIGAMLWGSHRTGPDRDVAKAYIEALANDRIDEAMAMRDPSAADGREMEQIRIDMVRQSGPVSDMSVVSASPDRELSKTTGRPVTKVTLTTAQAGTNFIREIRTVANPDGSRKVLSFP